MSNWNFEMIYKTKADYENDLKKIKEYTEKAEGFQGKLNNPEVLLDFYKFNDEVGLILSKAFCYARMNYDLDQKNTDKLNDYQVVYGLYMGLVSALSYADAEIISIGKDKIDEYFKNPAFKPYEFGVRKLFDGQKHVLSEKEEKLLSYFNAPLSNFNNLYDQIAVADNSSEKVTLSDGSVIDVSNANYTGYLEKLSNQDDRRKVFEAVYKYYDNHKNTFAAIYKGIIESDISKMKSRGYDSVLSSFLEHNNIPNDVFLNLVDVCRNNTESLKKYYRIRTKELGLERLHTYDRFVNLRTFDKEYSYEDAKALFFECIKSLGGDFEKRAHMVVEDGRVDVYIKDGKRTGAYSDGFYKEGPFILLNFNNRLDDCFTLAHEAGHSIHTSYANDFQPESTADYTIFVAEVASTFNEQLLLDYLLENAKEKDLKIVILQNAIDGIISTFYRQTLLANYEYEAHNLGIEGKPITADSLSNIMIDLYKTYYNHDLNTEDYKKFVWCYIPHMYHTPFYVYQYATSFASSLDIYNRVKNKEPQAFEKYIDLLKSGGSDYPVELLKRAGVDLTKKDAFMAVVKRLDDLVSQLEKLLEE